MQEMQVWFLGTEDPLEEEMVACSSILTWEIPWTEEPGRATVHGVTKSWTQLSMRAYRPWFYIEESWYMQAVPSFSNPVLILNVLNAEIRDGRPLLSTTHELTVALLSAWNILPALRGHSRPRWAPCVITGPPSKANCLLRWFPSPALRYPVVFLIFSYVIENS